MTDQTRKTAFSACWNERARIRKRLKKAKSGTVNWQEMINQVIMLDAAINELRA